MGATSWESTSSALTTPTWSSLRPTERSSQKTAPVTSEAITTRRRGQKFWGNGFKLSNYSTYKYESTKISCIICDNEFVIKLILKLFFVFTINIDDSYILFHTNCLS